MGSLPRRFTSAFEERKEKKFSDSAIESRLDTFLRKTQGQRSRVKTWTMKNNDTGQVITGQFAPQNYTENAGAKIPEVSTVNNQEPFPQWVGGEGETISYSARIFQVDPTVSVRDSVELLKNATKKDAKLNRAPIFTFTWGTEIAFRCFVVSVGGVRYDEITDTGEIRGASFTVALRKISKDISQFSLLQGASYGTATEQFKTGLSTIRKALGIDVKGGSIHTKGKTIRAKEGDTFESIAQQEYGSAILGDILRRAQPDKADLQPGDTVDLVDDVEVFQIEVTPQSVALQDNEAARTVRQLKFEARNRTAVKAF
jgi:hypothetical protein